MLQGDEYHKGKKGLGKVRGKGLGKVRDKGLGKVRDVKGTKVRGGGQFVTVNRRLWVGPMKKMSSLKD